MRSSFAVVSCLLIAASAVPRVCGQENRAVLTTTTEFDSGLATIAAVKTYKAASAQINVLDTDGRAALRSPVWETKPGESYGAQLAGALPGRGKSKYSVEFIVSAPKGDPGSAEVLITQSNDPTNGIMNLRRQVQDAFFKPDPATPPIGGDFFFNLGTTAGVYLEIWQGEPKTGRLRYFNRIQSVPSATPIHWDLMDSNKRLVGSDNYAATLTYQAPSLPAIRRIVRFAVGNH